MRSNTGKCSCVHFSHENPCLPLFVEAEHFEHTQTVKDPLHGFASKIVLLALLQGGS